MFDVEFFYFFYQVCFGILWWWGGEMLGGVYWVGFIVNGGSNQGCVLVDGWQMLGVFIVFIIFVFLVECKKFVEVYD